MPAVDSRLLVGLETFDDAAALKVSDELAICFSADFITPVVDDPTDWGRIAAANSLSDIYAMGAKPLAALNLLCWPDGLPQAMLSEVLQGGSSTAAEAGCLIVGGHTTIDPEPKYGLAVIGTIEPTALVRNQGAMPGDVLFLTKPLGTGILSTAIKRDAAETTEIEAAVETMASLNRAASRVALDNSARAMTDVTGFGLAGHLLEMLGPMGDLGVRLSMQALPLLPGVLDHMKAGRVPGGAKRNRDACRERVAIDPDVSAELEMLLYDPQTSGGLLIAIASEFVDQFVSDAVLHHQTVRRIGLFDATGRISVGL